MSYVRPQLNSVQCRELTGALLSVSVTDSEDSDEGQRGLADVRNVISGCQI